MRRDPGTIGPAERLRPACGWKLAQDWRHVYRKSKMNKCRLRSAASSSGLLSQPANNAHLLISSGCGRFRCTHALRCDTPFPTLVSVKELHRVRRNHGEEHVSESPSGADQWQLPKSRRRNALGLFCTTANEFKNAGTAQAERAQLLRFVLSNCRLDAASVYPTYREPFDLICGAAKTGEWYAQRDSNSRSLAS